MLCNNLLYFVILCIILLKSCNLENMNEWINHLMSNMVLRDASASKKHQLEKSTPPLALAMVTNMRYVCYHDICWGISISLSIQSFDKQVLHFRPQITWLKDGIELNSFSEHEHVSFDLSSFFLFILFKTFQTLMKTTNSRSLSGRYGEMR